MNPSPPESVLIVKMSAFGDIICSLPVLRALRDTFPQLRIGWVVDSRFEQLISQDPDIDELHVVRLSEWKRLVKSPLQWARLVSELGQLRRELRAGRYEVCLDLQGIVKSGVVARMSGSGRVLHMGSERIADRRRLFPGERIAPNGPHAVDRMLPMAAAIGADISNPRFDLFIPADAAEYAADLFREHGFSGNGPVVALNPGAAMEHRMWPADRFVAAARQLHDRIDARIVVLGGPDEVELGRYITDEADVGALCTAGKTTLLQLAAVVDRCDAMVTGDTGPQHMAYALDKPVVALFGPANPDRTGPYGDQHIVIQKPFPCQPCYAHPTCDDYACMKAIEVEEVVEAVLEVVGG